MSNIINSNAYVKQGDKVYKVNGGAGSPIHTFNSVEEMNAANLPDGTIACVPSSGESGGGAGFQLAEIIIGVDVSMESAQFTAEKGAELDMLAQDRMPVLFKFIEHSDDMDADLVLVELCSFMDAYGMQTMWAGLNYWIMCVEGAWLIQRSPLAGDQNG
jgi:hypothetical protein